MEESEKLECVYKEIDNLECLLKKECNITLNEHAKRLLKHRLEAILIKGFNKGLNPNFPLD